MTVRDLLVLDIDRTLLNSGEFSHFVTLALIEELGLDASQAEYLSAQTKISKGKMFDYLTWVEKEYGLVLPSAVRIAEAILSRDQEDSTAELERRVMLPGSFELFEAARMNGLPVLLMTAGSVRLQQLKILVIQALARRRSLGDVVRNYVITAPHQIKATLLVDAFYQNRFNIERLIERSLDSYIDDDTDFSDITRAVLVDDKPEYLASDDERFSGILVSADGEEVDSDDVLNTIHLLDVAEMLKKS